MSTCHCSKSTTQEYLENNSQESLEASKLTSLGLLNLSTCSIVTGQSHPIWKCGSDPLQVAMAATKALLLVGRYPLSGLSCAGENRQPKCPLCMEEPETITHFLVTCKTLECHRAVYIQQLKQAIPHLYDSNNPDMIANVIVDPSHITTSKDAVTNLEDITRRLCFKLHNHRSMLMGLGSMNTRAFKRLGGSRVMCTKTKSLKSIKKPPTRWGSPA